MCVCMTCLFRVSLKQARHKCWSQQLGFGELVHLDKISNHLKKDTPLGLHNAAIGYAVAI